MRFDERSIIFVCRKNEEFCFENKMLIVRRTVQRVYLGKKETKVISTTPKSKKSIRKIPMNSFSISSAEVACSASVLASGQLEQQSLGDTCHNQLAK